MGAVRDPAWADAWQQSWDRLEAHLVPDHELRISVLLDVFAGVVDPAPTVVDLGCGTGTVTCRLLNRFPTARSIAVDVDPVLLAIASATFADDHRVRVVTADLRDAAWVERVPEAQVDAVLTATALHWLPEQTVRRVYGDVARLVRPGGVVAHTEQMPLAEPSHLGAGLTGVERRRVVDGGSRWNRWWEDAARDPALRSAVARRRAVFPSNYPAEEFSPPADWHIAALLAAGFEAADVVWRSGAGAVVAAVR